MKISAEHVLWSAPAAERLDRPVLLLLHGHGMNEQVGSELWHQLPAELVMASVRGPQQARGGYAWFPLDATLSLQAIEDSATAVLRWMDEVGLDRPVGILGFSQGVATAFQMVRRAPERFSYAVNLSGAVVPFPARTDAALSARRLPVFYARGAADAVIPGPLVEATRSWLTGATRLTERVYPGLGHNVSPTELADLATFIREQLPPALTDP